MATVVTTKESRAANFSMQLEEIELLESMYSEEFKVEDQTALLMLRTYVNGTGNEFPKSLTLSARLNVDSIPDNFPHEDEDEDSADERKVSTLAAETHKVEVFFHLTPTYPCESPQINIRSNELTRHTHDVINEDVKDFLSETIEPGESCLMQAIQWVVENGGKYFPVCVKQGVGKDECDGSKFCRMWLYMHHIYSKTKRRNILQLAKEYNLSGFCLPGKPGVVCVEGTAHTTTEYYLILRSWNWKSITCRKREVEDIPVGGSIEAFCHIEGFRELSFDTHGHRSNHMDMGQFRTYLEQHKLEYAFKFLFGIETELVSNK
jgi:hypothetical protein